MNKNSYLFSNDGKVGYCTVSTGVTFIFDALDYELIRQRIWYSSTQGRNGECYIIDCRGKNLHRFLMNAPNGYEVDHIDLNPLNNQRSNLQICTHQQNQCNQPPQCNNASGVTGVSYYSPRKKYRARIKAFQNDIHLGYYMTFIEAIQARKAGMKLMFGKFGYLNDTAPIPNWIEEKVYKCCSRFINQAAVSFYSNGNIIPYARLAPVEEIPA